MPNEKKVELKQVNKKTELGQVFTPEPLARFVISLIKLELKDSQRLLDPCIGYNVFFSQLSAVNKKLGFVGIELDEELLTEEVRSFYNKPSRQLLNTSFFDYPVTEKFDFIIQNPPYVRQELLTIGDSGKKSLLRKLPEKATNLILPQSNLYIYFLIKSLFHLKENGRLLALTYDSWLYSRFGVQLKETLLKFGNINAIYHFRHSGFPDAAVGATVIDFSKTVETSNDIKIYRYSDPAALESSNAEVKNDVVKITRSEFISYRSNEPTLIDFSSDFFIKIDALSAIPPNRGTSSLGNKFFIHRKPEFKESVPFIKNVAGLNELGIVKPDSYLLVIDSDCPSQKTHEHLDFIKDEVSNSDKYKSIKNQLAEGKNWYRIKPSPAGNIVFNYYLRRNIDFFANENYILCSDTFYNIKITKNFNVAFAVLNSTFTKLAILSKARNQGRGLKKIQLYEFKDTDVCSYEKFSLFSLKNLNELGDNLKTVDRFSKEKQILTQKIDKILIDEYNKVFVDNNLSVDSLYRNLTELLN